MGILHNTLEDLTARVIYNSCKEFRYLKGIANAPWYVRNVDLHRDWAVETVADVIR